MKIMAYSTLCLRRVMHNFPSEEANDGAYAVTMYLDAPYNNCPFHSHTCPE